MRGAPALFPSAGARARGTVIALGVVILAAVASIGHALWGFGVLERVEAGTLTMAEAEAWENLEGLIALAYLLGFVAAAGAFLAWIYRIVDNTPVVGGGMPMVSPRAAVGWWFVPIANYLMPYRIVRDVNERLATERQPGGDRLLVAWWLVWVGSNLISLGVWRLDAASIAGLRSLIELTVVAETATVIAGVLAILVVRQIQRREDERAGWLSQSGYLPPTPPLPAWASNSPGTTQESIQSR